MDDVGREFVSRIFNPRKLQRGLVGPKHIDDWDLSFGGQPIAGRKDGLERFVDLVDPWVALLAV